MELIDNRLLIAVLMVAVAYILFRSFKAAGKNSRIYKQHVEKILSSDEYKVKGRFED